MDLVSKSQRMATFDPYAVLKSVRQEIRFLRAVRRDNAYHRVCPQEIAALHAERRPDQVILEQKLSAAQDKVNSGEDFIWTLEHSLAQQKIQRDNWSDAIEKRIDEKLSVEEDRDIKAATEHLQALLAERREALGTFGLRHIFKLAHHYIEGEGENPSISLTHKNDAIKAAKDALRAVEERYASARKAVPLMALAFASQEYNGAWQGPLTQNKTLGALLDKGVFEGIFVHPHDEVGMGALRSRLIETWRVQAALMPDAILTQAVHKRKQGLAQQELDVYNAETQRRLDIILETAKKETRSRLKDLVKDEEEMLHTLKTIRQVEAGLRRPSPSSLAMSLQL